MITLTCINPGLLAIKGNPFTLDTNKLDHGVLLTLVS